MMTHGLVGMAVTPPGAYELSVAMAVTLSALCCLCVAVLASTLVRRSRGEGSEAAVQSALRTSIAGIMFSGAAAVLILVT